MIHILKKLFKKNSFKIQSFTFYIPSPPPRISGYREKQFDKIFFHFINKGYKILNFSTTPSQGEKQSGMWIVILVKATTEEANDLNLEEFVNDELAHSNSNSSIEFDINEVEY